MTRAELLRALVRQAKANGFEFRRWYTNRLALPWISFDAAVTALAEQRRYYALLFSHEFAQTFWLAGSKMTFIVPTNRFTRVTKGGSIVVERKGHTRRTVLPDAWRFHLKNMAAEEEPLRYIRRFLLIEEDLEAIQPLSDEQQEAKEQAKFSGISQDEYDEELTDEE